MKAITVKQPLANLICAGIKDIENRTWKTKFRGRVLIHAGATPVKFSGVADIFTKEQNEQLPKDTRKLVELLSSNCGSIIGSVEIVDCVVNHESVWSEKTDKFAQIFIKPTYNWVLANPILFEEPIPAKGKLSFWEFDLEKHGKIL